MHKFSIGVYITHCKWCEKHCCQITGLPSTSHIVLMTFSVDLLEYNHDCLFQLCSRCSNEEELFNEILKSASNKNLKRKCSWKCWKNTTKMVNGKQCSAFRRITTWDTFQDLINQYMSDVLSMRQHLFHLKWQRLQFGDFIVKLATWRSITRLHKKLQSPGHR